MDVFDKKTRSRIMSRIRGRDTKVELALRGILRKMESGSVRYQPKIPHSPDFWLPRCNLLIFVDGCFWHGCPKHYKEPKSNVKFWRDKIANNKKRDARNRRRLRASGYKVLSVWEHQVWNSWPLLPVKLKNRILNERR